MKIAVINTGGTISCTGNPLAPMSASAFAAASQTILDPIVLQSFPKLNLHYVTDLIFPESSSGTLDSTNLQPTDWCLMASYILKHYVEYDGWIVLHGTDSMDFTGTALPFLLSSFSKEGYSTASLSKPIIITGSQVPMFYQDPSSQALSLNFNTDAYQNFCGAVATAQSGIPEVCVYFDGALYRGNRSVKKNASGFNAFFSPNYPALAEYGIELTVQTDLIQPPPVSNQVSLDNATVRETVQEQLAYISEHINNYPVMQFNAFPAWYSMTPSEGIIASLIQACGLQGIQGLILESYGEGNFPSGNPDHPEQGATYQALKAVNDSGVVIVDCTQVVQGVVNNSAYAAGAWLPSIGALSPADMTPMAALAKLMILRTSAGHAKNNWSLDEVKRLFQLNLLGEMLNVSRLDSRTNSTLLPGQKISALDGSAALSNDPETGPVLTDNTGKVLWCALPHPSSNEMPGRLIMQNDGNLVFYSRYNSPMWATNTGNPSGASSMLVLDGSCSKNNLSLKVDDYSHNRVSAVLYKQA
jgi:L-asparaginase